MFTIRHDDVAVWPYYHEARLFFSDFRHTQWRAGAGGFKSLGYTACARLLELLRASRDGYSPMREIEVDALEAAHAQNG